MDYDPFITSLLLSKADVGIQDTPAQEMNEKWDQKFTKRSKQYNNILIRGVISRAPKNQKALLFNFAVK